MAISAIEQYSLEVIQMLLVAQPAERVDLQRVVVHRRVLKETVVRVEHLLGQQVEPLARQPTVIQPCLALKLHPQLRLEQVHLGDRVDDPVRVLQDRRPPDLDVDLVRDVGLQKFELEVLFFLK